MGQIWPAARILPTLGLKQTIKGICEEAVVLIGNYFSQSIVNKVADSKCFRGYTFLYFRDYLEANKGKAVT